MSYGHRPIFPEYYPNYRERKLVFLEKGALYDSDGLRLYHGDIDCIIDYIISNPIAVFTGSLDSISNIDFLQEMVYDRRCKVLCTKRGRPIMGRIQAKRETRWVATSNSWGRKEDPDPQWLRAMEGLYEYYGLGYYPTPSSIGVGLMRQIWKHYKLPRHYSPSYSVEKFIRDNAVGGIVQTPGLGKRYKKLGLLDMSSAWVSQYVVHPTGTAEAINGGCDLSQYFEYFVECDVFVPHTLPLGPFPVRTGEKNGQRVVYPTEEGMYRSVFLWRIQIEDTCNSGCYVSIKRGYGWREYTTDNSIWSESSYKLRMEANSEFISRKIKAINVAAIGRHFRSREMYTIKGGSIKENKDLDYLISNQGDPIDMYIDKEVDNRSALMVHWYVYTIAQCNSNVYNFALPYAKEGRLVAIDYDSIMVIENDDTGHFIRKHSFEALSCPPGTWLYIQLHNVHILNHRSFKSEELVKMPGVMR